MAFTKSKNKNIFIRYFLVSSLIVLLSFAVLGASLMLFMTDYWKQQQFKLMEDNTSSIAKTVAVLLPEDLVYPNYPRDNNPLYYTMFSTLDLLSRSIDSDIFVTDMAGKVIACKDFPLSVCPIHGQITVPAEILSSDVVQKGSATVGTLGDAYEDNHYIVGSTVYVEGSPVAYVFATKRAYAGMRPYAFDLARMFLFSSLFALILAFIGTYLFTYNLVKPLRQMSRATKAYAKGDFTYRVKVKSGDEMEELASAFNSMAKSLGVLESSRRSFVANVSHELKTPMTSIGGFIDGILDGTIPPEKEEYYLKIVSSEVYRLSRLVTSMLNMAKIEAGEVKLDPSRYDISNQIFEIMITFEETIQNNHIQVKGLDQMHSIFIDADKDMIHQVVYNLIDNAVKFTPDYGEISVSALASDERVVVRIRNTGDGIPAQDIPSLFDRFYKVDKSRSLDAKSSGLGLYIVKNIVNIHGGDITATSVQGEYAEFVYWLPTKFRGESS